jgi:diguanylate cyclase (GGDEF)-like protein
MANQIPLPEVVHTADLLAHVPLFSGLERVDLERLARAVRCEAFAPGEEIVRIGDAGHALFVVLDGTVTVVYPSRSADVELARMGAGDFFGEMAILNEKPRSATVRALEPVRLLVLEKEDFTRIVIESPRVALRVMETLSGRIRHTDEHLSGMSEQALRDALTGLLNRRSFQDRLAEECDRGRRYGDGFALLLLDLDHFKAINDGFGHDLGDSVLAWVGRLLLEHTRGADIPFRIGGEEFAVICPGTGSAEATAAATRLVAVVEEARPPVRHRLRPTLSAGFAVYPDHGRRPDQLYQAADQALLRAKSGGRNQVVGAASGGG